MQKDTDKRLFLSAAQTRDGLADEMGVHRNTIRTMLASVGITGRKRLSVAQLLRFYAEFPPPGEYAISHK